MFLLFSSQFFPSFLNDWSLRSNNILTKQQFTECVVYLLWRGKNNNYMYIYYLRICLSLRNANTISNTRSTYTFYAVNILFDLRDQSFRNDGKNWDEICKKKLLLIIHKFLCLNLWDISHSGQIIGQPCWISDQP
jgi:hypothetical protein